MNKKEIKEQLREICTVANSLAGALSSLTVRLSTDIMLDDEVFHHCGQDADEHQPEGYTYKDLLGMEVISYGGKAMKCEGCSWDCSNCVKVELVGGTYMCLRKPQQQEDVEPDQASKSLEDVYRENMELVRRHSIEQSEANQRLFEALKEGRKELKKTVISFDEEESNVMDDIKEKTEDFLNYLDGIFNTKEQ